MDLPVHDEVKKLIVSRTCLERPAIDGDSPVGERAHTMKVSKARHVKPCLNMGGPSSKAKYS